MQRLVHNLQYKVMRPLEGSHSALKHLKTWRAGSNPDRTNESVSDLARAPKQLNSEAMYL